ncbi:MAG TPA: ABC transporter substrate-binding protein [Coprothermobacter proteolyticus]|nr:ABC transporter substrate-binding protein [Coprothermobacter proteolyticus]
MKRILKTLLGENCGNLKTLLVSVLVVALCMGFFVAGVPEAKAQTAPKEMLLVMKIGSKSYNLNGVSYQMEVAPEIIKGRTFVPIRFIGEAFGGDVGWQDATRTVTLKSEGKTIKFTVGRTSATVDGKPYTLDAAPYIKNSRTMVPVRFVSEVLGLSVYYEPQKKLVYISAKPSYVVPGVTDKEIKIGSFSALSGPLAVIGVPFYHGLQSYINWINDQGGINGRNIKVVIADDQMNPALTVPAVKKFVEEDKVFAVVGGLGSPGCLAVMDYLNEKGVPFVYQGGGDSAFANPPKKYVFAVQPNYMTEGQVFVKFAKQDLNASKFALLYQNDEAGKEGAEGVKEGINKYGGSLVYSSSFPGTETDFTSYLTRIKNSGAEVIFVYAPANTAAGANVVKTAKSLGLTQKIILPYSYAGILAMAGEAAEGVYITGWVDFSDPEDPDVQKFFEIWLSYYPNDDPLTFAYAVAGFAAAEIFVEALRRTGQYPTRDAMVWALETFDGWSGYVVKDISYGPNKRGGKYSLYFMKVENQELKKITDWISAE